MAQLPSAFSCHLSRVASSDAPLACTGKSTIVVVPPKAAAIVPVSKVSAENVPPNGISRCVCTSIPPGSTYFPVASMTSPARAATASLAPGASTAAICSPSTSTSAGKVPVELTTVPFLIRMLTWGVSLWPDEAVVGIGTAVPVELPQVPDLGRLAHVEVADDHLVGGVARGVAHQ